MTVYIDFNVILQVLNAIKLFFKVSYIQCNRNIKYTTF